MSDYIDSQKPIWDVLQAFEERYLCVTTAPHRVVVTAEHNDQGQEVNRTAHVFRTFGWMLKFSPELVEDMGDLTAVSAGESVPISKRLLYPVNRALAARLAETLAAAAKGVHPGAVWLWRVKPEVKTFFADGVVCHGIRFRGQWLGYVSPVAGVGKGTPGHVEEGNPLNLVTATDTAREIDLETLFA